jgi:hypothetical protein
MVGSRTHLSQAGSKEHTLEELPHPLKELIHMRPLQHVHLQRQEIAGWSVMAGAGETWVQMPIIGRIAIKGPMCGVQRPDCGVRSDTSQTKVSCLSSVQGTSHGRKGKMTMVSRVLEIFRKQVELLFLGPLGTQKHAIRRGLSGRGVGRGC